jgi:hypothetical protein
LFNLSLSKSEFPTQWKTASVYATLQIRVVIQWSSRDIHIL